MDCRIFKHTIAVAALCLTAACQHPYELALDFALNRDALRFTKAESQSYFLVYSQGTWSVSVPEEAGWVRLGRTEGSGTQQVTVYCSANAGTSRGVTATITNHDGEKKTVYISQEGAVSLPVYTFDRQAAGLLGVPASIRIPVSTNLDAASVADAEITVDYSAGDGWIHGIQAGVEALTFSIDAYDGVEPREATVTAVFPAAEWDLNRCMAVLTVRQGAETPRLDLEESYVLDPMGAEPTRIVLGGNFEPSLYPDYDGSTFSVEDDSWIRSAVYDAETASLLILPTKNRAAVRSTGLTVSLKDASGTVLDTRIARLVQDVVDMDYDYEDAVLLSDGGRWAVCYLLEDMDGGKYGVEVRHGDGSAVEGLVSASILWQSSKDLVRFPLFENGTAWFTVSPGMRGNAVLVLKDDGGKAAWTLHVWVAGEAVGTNTFGGKVFMDRNVGAVAAGAPASTAADAAGLQYQWGRKDPFPGVDAYISGTANRDHVSIDPADAVSFTVAQDGKEAAWVREHPSVYLWGSAASGAEDWMAVQDDGLWRGGNGAKTDADPCPHGWRVPAQEDFTPVLTPLKEGTFARFGISCTDDDGAACYFPASGYYRRTQSAASQLCNVGTHGLYWTSSSGAYNTDYRGGVRLQVQSGVSGRSLGTVACRWSGVIRCIKG